MRTLLWAALALAAALPAAAQPLDGRTAQKMLFSPKGLQAVLRPGTGLSATDQKMLEVMVKLPAFLENATYYGAVAISPGDGLQHESIMLAKNLHSPEAAEAAALKGCNAKRSAAQPCIVVADLVPKQWTRQPLMLNAAATADFRKYRQGGGPKALAISPATGIYSIAKGPNADRAAMNDCLARAQPMGATDCAVVVADP